MPHKLPDPTLISRVPYDILGLFQTFGGTHENLELQNANLREIADRIRDLRFIPTITVVNDYETSIADAVVLIDATSNNVTINLHSAVTSRGDSVILKRIDGSGNTVTYDGFESETIDGDLTNTLASQFDSIIIVSDGSSWHII